METKGANMNTEQFWDRLSRSMPPVFPRKDVPKFMGSLITPAALANLDSKGVGPIISLKIGKYTAYEKISFITWLKTRYREK